MMPAKNLFYAQSGGVTAVINATACGVIETARRHADSINRVFAGRHGIVGALREELIDTGLESDQAIAALRQTPGGAFGSCRYKLPSVEAKAREYQRLLEVFKAHDIGMFLYNGGGDSLDTAWKVQQYVEQQGYPLAVIGVPKTVDNDLGSTDNCPGFGSVAKYIAASVREASFDVASMCETSTEVFIMEVMGRHAGWIAAAGGLAQEQAGVPPIVILFPEVPFQQAAFLAKVKAEVEQHGYCVVVVSEGARDVEGQFLAIAGSTDAFGHAQLGGVAPVIASLISNQLKLKCHWAVADYLQRSARHIASATDVAQSYAVGQAAVEFAIDGKSGVMPALIRAASRQYSWHIGEVPLASVANIEKLLPKEYLSADGFGITQAAKEYLEPLIQGEAPPSYHKGLPNYVRLKNQLIATKLEPFEPS